MAIDKIFFLLPSKGKFLNNFANDQLKAQAEQVWLQLDGLSPILLCIGIVIGCGIAAYYYTGFNEMPGRHYKIKHWGLWTIFSFVLTLIATAAIEYISIKTHIKTGITSIYWICAINNALYSLLCYFITSVIWCNFGRTNAYKFLKF